MSNDALLERFALEHFERNSIVAHRRAATLKILGRVAAQVAPRTLDQITPSDVMAWQGTELGRGIKPNTMRNHESMLHAFVKWLHIAELITFERMSVLKMVPPVRGANARGRPRPYKRPEIARLREALAQTYPLIPESGAGSNALRGWTGPRADRSRARVRSHARRLQFDAQIALALEQGLRLTEIHGLTIARMHPDNESVVVTTAKSKPGEHREREVPYTDHARECVRDWLAFRAKLADHGLPWLMHLTEPQAYESLRRSLEVFDGSGTKFRWHRLRHTFATERLRAGLPLEKLQVMMGHANLQQTLVYAEIVSSDVVSEAERTADAFARNLGLEAA